MTTLNDFIEEQLKDPVFKEKYDALEPEYSLMFPMLLVVHTDQKLTAAI